MKKRTFKKLSARSIGYVVGKKLVSHNSLERLTLEFNLFRARKGLSPVKVNTVQRYNGLGKGYENGPPKLYKQFLLNQIV